MCQAIVSASSWAPQPALGGGLGAPLFQKRKRLTEATFLKTTHGSRDGTRTQTWVCSTPKQRPSCLGGGAREEAGGHRLSGSVSEESLASSSDGDRSTPSTSETLGICFAVSWAGSHKARPTPGTIAINRIYFVQLSLTYTQPLGLPRWVVGRRLAFGVAPKSVDRHTRTGTHSSCAWLTPLQQWVGWQGLQCQASRDPSALGARERRAVGLSWVLPEKPGAPARGAPRPSRVGSGQGIGRSVVRRRVQERQRAWPAPCR